MPKLIRIGGSFRQYVFPQRLCPGCGTVTGTAGLCPACRHALYTLPRCQKCAAFVDKEGACCQNCHLSGKLPFSKARAALPYGGTLRENILGFKYYNKTWLARPFGLILKELLEAEFRAGAFDLIVPVPLARDRLQSRGYNQAELLAGALSKQLALPVLPRALKRVVDTPPLAALARQERLSILKDAFSAEEGLVKGKSILLVDDIFTTGATAIACSQALKKAKAGDIQVAALAAGKA